MRIGFFTDSYLPRLDGIAISVDTFRRALEDIDHEVFVFCPKRPNMPDDDHVIPFRSVPSIWYEGYRDTLPITRSKLRIVRDANLDIVHTHTQTQMGLFGLWAAKKLRLPLVTTQHADLDLIREHRHLIIPMVALNGLLRLIAGSHIHHHPPKPSLHTASRRYVGKVVARYNNACDLVVTPSNKMLKQLLDCGTKRPIEVLPTGVDLDSINHDHAKWRQRQRAKLGLSPTDVVFMSTARLAPEKRVPIIVKQFLAVKEESADYNLHLVVVGDGPDLTRVKQLLANAGSVSKSVHLIGRVPRGEVYHWLHAADVYINICLRETQGLTISEAVAAGLPVIIADPDISPVVKHRFNGLIIDSDEELREVIKKFYKNPATIKEYGERSKKLAKSYTVLAQAIKLESFYKRLVP